MVHGSGKFIGIPFPTNLVHECEEPIPHPSEALQMQLTQNVGTVDRILRIVAGVSILGLALAGIPAAPLAWGTATVAVVLLVTGTTGFCPLYALLGLSTRPAKA